MRVHSIVSVEVVLMTEGVDGVHRTTSVRFFPFVLPTARHFDDALTHLDSTQVPSVERIPRKPEHVVIGISITVQEKVVQRIRHVDLVLLIPIAAGAEE